MTIHETTPVRQTGAPRADLPATAEELRAELLRSRLAGRRDRRGGTAGPHAPAPASLPRADRTAPLPLSAGQQQMWFLNRLEPDSVEYLVPMVLRLRGALDTAALATAWQTVTDRHEILRTRYGLSGVEPVQLVDPPAPVPLPLDDLTGEPRDERDALAAARVERELATPFDLAAEWPCRARLVRTAEDEHILVMAFHHIACDAWSTRLLADELSTLYTRLSAGDTSPLPPLETQYADYAAWQHRQLTGPLLERHLAHWRERLAGALPAELPTDRPRPPVRDTTGADVPVTFPDGLADRIRGLAAGHGTTPFAVLLTAFQVLVARYTGQSDVSVGTVVSGRVRPELQRMIGYGINTLVMRGSWAGDPGFGDLLTRTRAAVLDAFDHQEVPFARLVDELQPERDMSRTPLHQVAFTLHEQRLDAFALPGLTVEPYARQDRVAKYELTLQIEEGADGSLGGALNYATALFDRTTVERMAGHLVRLLDAATAHPDLPVSRLSILGDAELAVVTGSLSGFRAGPPVDRCVHQAFEEQAEATPDAIAVTAGTTHLTYRELNERANRVAHQLRAMGAGPEQLVGLCLERGAELMPALLGILKSGAGYLPLDPANPADRLAYVMADAGARIVIGSERTAPALADAHGVRTLFVDRDADLVDARPATNPEPLAGPGSTVYVIYTSGSTGRPKGVVLEHGNVLRLLTTAHEHYGFTAEDVWTMFHSYAFDVSVFEMWGALLHGGRLVVVGQDVTRSPSDFLDLLVAERATVLSQTPTAFRSLVAAAGSGDPRIDRLSLRAVVFAGEKLEVPELRPWLERVGPGGPALVNMYGITETTVHTTYHRIEEADLAPLAGNRVGHPLSDLSVYLLDASGNPAPIGVPGEIHVGGPGVARGYLGRPELTAERFVPDPFGPPGARLYRSGDAARRRPDGSLEFLGRIDTQVKIRGYRVELGEIAHALLEHPGVGEAVVQVRTDSGDKQLVGYLVEQEPGSLPAAGELRTLLRRTLPEYMIPAAFVSLDRIPLTVNGKLDHRALPAPDTTTLRGTAAYTAPRTPVEERVVAVWSDVLGVDRVGVEDSFFDLGGDSIRAIALVGALREAGHDVSVRDVFDFRTVERLCASMTGEPPLAVAAATVEPFALIDAADRAALPAGVVDAYPLSQMQLGMVVEMLADPGRNLYHNVSTFRIRDERPFDPEAFAEAGRIVTARHEVLRTSIALDGHSRPLQLVHARAEMPMGVRDLSGLDAAAVDGALRAFTAEERRRVFDLAVPSLMRFHAHLTGDGTGWWISVTECHPILEGWGHHSLLMELIGVYQAVRDGREPEPFDAPAVRFADFVAGELRAVDSAEDRAYWQEVVTGHAPLRLPRGWGDDPGTPRETVQAGIAWTDLEEGLRALAARARTSLKSVMVAAHLTVMSGLTEETAFHTGLVCDARPELPGADRVLGMYLNTLPFAHDRSARTWDELVRQVFAREVGLWDHRRYPMAAIQRQWGGSRRLLDVYFNYQDFRQVDAGLVDHEGGIDDSPSEFPLTVSSRVGHIIVTCDSHTVNRAHAERLAGMYRRVLEAMAADPDGDTGIDLLSDEERRLLTGVNDTAVPRGAATAYDLFAERASAAPDAVALLWDGEEYSYGWLLERAEAYGRRLHALGAGPESVVGLLLDRTPDLVAAMLGTWRAGASYVPLDPAFPADRIGYVLADAGAGPVVTEPAFAPVLDGLHDGPRLVRGEAGDEAGDEPGDARPTEAPPVRAEAGHLAYTLYTSGSTGRPKGVGIAHAALANLLLAMAERLGSTRTDTWLSLTSVSFDISGLELFLPLVTGGRLVLADGLDTKDGAVLTRLVERYALTHVQATPSGWNLLLRSGFERSAITALVGGEALPAELAGELRARVDRLLNVYGPTETTIWSTSWDVPEGAERISIGRPIANNTVYVLDARSRPVPPGVAGELHIGGEGLARGYRNLPARTAESFGPDPFSAVPGARMYRTGDIVRMRPDGTLAYVGRADDQVKIRGVRIEPGEIEAALTTLPGVAHTAVAVREDTPGDKRLVAYVVPAGADAPDPGELRRLLGALLPEAMLPSAFVTLEALPLNAAGKIDRRALPAPADDASATGDHLAPRTPSEERMAAVWAEVLGVDRVGVQDSFFGLGGDSLRAVNLVGALRAAGYDLSVRDVFEQRTIAGLAEAAAVRPVLAEGITAVAPFALIEPDDRRLVPAGVADAYPASQLQLGMLVEMLADAGGATYHQCVSIRVDDDEPFREDALRRAVADVTARHDVLRTSFDLTGFSRPMQLVHETVDIPVRVHDLRGRDEAARDAALDAFLTAEQAVGFDPARAPLLRLAVHLESDAAWRITFGQPHAITQGWAQFSLVTELVDRYREIRDGRTDAPGHQAPPIRYADFVAAELESLSQGVDSAFWKGVTHGNAPLRIPAGWGEPGDRRTHVVPVDLADLEGPLRAFASRCRVPLKSVLLAAHLTVMGRLTEEEAFHTGLVVDARPAVLGSDRVLGMYLNTLPFAHDRSARTWDELVRRVYDREAGLWEHRRYPMAAIQREAPGTRRQIDVLFNYHDLRLFDSERIDAGSSVGRTTTEFALTVATGGQGLHLTADSRVLSRANGERLARMYRAVLVSMAASPAGDPRLAYLGEAEEERLRSFTQTAREPAWVAVEEELDRYAAEDPVRTALTADGVELSYAEVAAESNRLAHHLRALGVGPDTVVGLHARRSPALVLAVLAVLKAGGAWLPLDPALPADRLAYMARDARVAVLLGEPAPDGLDLTTVPLDRPTAWAGHPATAPEPVADPDHLAYVIYTSGSTGRPKGVHVTRRGMANHLLAKVEDLELTGADSVVQNAPASFDISVWQMLVAFVVGGRVRVVDETAAADPAALFGRTADERITVLEVVPSLLRAALDAWDAGLITLDLPALRRMVVTGEALPPDLCRRWFARFPQIPMVNAYGPTECSDDVTHAVVRAGDPVGEARVTIGRPVRNTRLYVLDAAMTPVPVGVPGELYAGGTGVSRGYGGRPALTAERFLPDPFGPAGSRLYRTGDVAAWNEDGTIEFLGRVDHQVKVRGVRIELGEIEAALTALESVADAAVAVRRGPLGHERLIGYVVTADGTAPDPATLREGLATTLPEAMIPAGYVPLPVLPLTPNGKVDRRALPEPAEWSTAGDRPYTEPATATERRIAAVWSQTLGIARIGREDGFFRLGGDSILVIRVIAACRRAGLDISLFLLYQHDTLAALAAAVDAAAVTAAAAQAPPRPASGPEFDPRALREALVADGAPGASLAVIEGGELVALEAIGTLGADSDEPVTPDTLFQAGSWGKHVTAFAVLRLVDQGVLDLDTDAGAYLRGWRLPDTEHPVTIRHLLSHLGGLAETPRRAVRRGRPVPSLTRVLSEGAVPERPAGEGFRKSNAHYSVLEQLLTDVTGEPFESLMRRLVLDPLGMTGSSFDPSFPERSGRPVALGHDEEGRTLEGGWLVHPERAAAGLWTTAADMARCELELRRSYLGRPLALLSPESARQMLTPHSDGFYGLGTIVDTGSAEVEYGHGGSPGGYQALSMNRLHRGSGVVVLTNGEFSEHVLKAVGADR